MSCLTYSGGAAAGLPGLHGARHTQGSAGPQRPGEGCEYNHLTSPIHQEQTKTCQHICVTVYSLVTITFSLGLLQKFEVIQFVLC